MRTEKNHSLRLSILGLMDLEILFQAARDAVPAVAAMSDAHRAQVLCAVADAVYARRESVLGANAKDLARMEISNPKYERLKLTPARLRDIVAAMRKVAQLPSPLGKMLAKSVLPNGLEIRKIAVPIGVIGVIYEARPNVMLDVFSLCLKSGNVCVLKGAHDAAGTNLALAEIVRETLENCGVPAGTFTFLPASREAAYALLNARRWVDLVIPRGGRELIDFVRENARLPVIETGAGICHCYVDESADIDKARAIVNNAKTRRASVCNALDCLLVHVARLGDLPKICEPLAQAKVEIFADVPAYEQLAGKYPEALLKPATPESFGTEFLDYKMSVHSVPVLEDALAHIARYGSHHSESIVSEDATAIALFQERVDAACVYANASTAFTDGEQFGFGAEIGISTQKLHARGPMGLEALTTYKYVIAGTGQIRE